MEGKFDLSRDNKIEAEKSVRIFFIRHSRASYSSYAEKLASDEPESPISLDSQLPDLPESGVELAEKSAESFLSNFDNTDTALFIVSSTQARALQTAKIYSEVAIDKGFEITAHEKDYDNHVSEFGGEYVRKLESLSLHSENQVFQSVFNPANNSPKINWEAVRSETKEKFDMAREIVMADDQGSWGANFYLHATKVKELIPEIETPEELHETQYRDLQQLAQFARKKATGDKKVIVLAFGHENYMGQALEHDTGEHGVGNTEVIEFGEDGGLSRF
jgi:phosphohistidine phosphatase SixA